VRLRYRGRMAASAVLPEVSIVRTRQRWSPSARLRAGALLLVSFVILALGAVEDVYGNTDRGDVYGSDAVQYLDIARALERHDFRSALNPLWSQGYPVLLAVARPLFAPSPDGDWEATRVVNFMIFAADYFAFLYLLTGMMGTLKQDRGSPARRSVLFWVAGLALFVATQICLGQVSRVNPDQLVTIFFFLALGLILRILHRKPTDALRLWQRGALLGLILGLGFIAKAVFLALGCGILLLLTVALWCRRERNVLLIAAATFALIVGGYGAALSRATGHFTLGESGSINYAWHVNRLQKWVHWQGGIQTAAEAWPKASIARFAQWNTRPPDFGQPVHPTTILQQSPVVYGFSAPIHATYVPYFDPPYFYEGYRHLIRPRYQLIALAKSLGDLAQTLWTQPIFFALLLALAILLARRDSRRTFKQWLRTNWLIPAIALFAVAIYLPVHLEGRYLAGFLAVLGLAAFLAASADGIPASQRRLLGLIVVLGLAGDIARYQLPVWRNVMHHKSPRNNEEWKTGEAVLAEHLPLNAEVGVLSWTPNLQSDWAYIAHLDIIGEIASGPDLELFWRSSPAEQVNTLDTLRRAGAVAVFTRNKPSHAGGPAWKQFPGTNMWIYRF
jgi:hypothetical protein